MKSDTNLKFYAIILTIVAVALIWVVGSGNAAQEELQSVVYNKGLLAQANTDGKATDANKPKHSIAYYTKLMADIAYKIHTRYMEDIDAEDLMQSGIKGMLENLDPYSVVLKKKTYNHLMENTQGKYEGLGMQIDLREDRVTIISPIEGTPAYRLGLSAGDKIMMIDSTSTEGMSTEDAANLMRGPAGTSVKLSILRPGISEELEYVVERAVIELKSVRFYGMIDDKIGYVRLDKFAEQTTRELEEAILDMKNNQGMKSLIFDLRSNGGGLLDQAISVANLFLPQDKLVVYTQGKYPTSQKKYYSRKKPIFPEGKLVILVNGGTASASEIVSGAIQDWDRGVILGSTTFGKGLVQQIFGGHTSDITLKLTTAKYYIPSGRCIQKPERAKKHPTLPVKTAAIDLDEKELNVDKDVFFTADGREVYGGGGIVPDIKIKEETWKPIEYNLVRKNMFFDFAVDYATHNGELKEDFKVTNKMVDEFRTFIKKHDFDYKTALEIDLEKFEETADKLESKDIFAKDLSDMRKLIAREKEKDFDKSIDYIKQSIKRELLRKQFGERGIYRQLTLKEDKGVKRALEILRDKKEYGKLLKPELKKAEG